jgi:hypothetical protein
MILFVADAATPVAVFVLAAIMGLVRPSDITLRSLLVGETMPAELLMRAMGVSRTTADSARVVGALSGAGLVAMLGAGPAYVLVCTVYLVSFALTLSVGIRKVRVLGEGRAPMSPFAALKEGFAYVWSTPDVRATTLLAFLVNFAAYPIISSLLAYVAKDIYGLDQTGLGWLIASFAGGALAGSILLSTHGAWIRPARTMIACAVLWFVCNLAFSWVQSFCMVPMAVLLMRTAEPAFRGRVMGVRMLAVYGLPLGLLLSGPLVEHLGFSLTGTLYSLVGIGATLMIASRWRAHLWSPLAAANLR